MRARWDGSRLKAVLILIPQTCEQPNLNARHKMKHHDIYPDQAAGLKQSRAQLTHKDHFHAWIKRNHHNLRCKALNGSKAALKVRINHHHQVRDSSGLSFNLILLDI